MLYTISQGSRIAILTQPAYDRFVKIVEVEHNPTKAEEEFGIDPRGDWDVDKFDQNSLLIDAYTRTRVVEL